MLKGKTAVITGSTSGIGLGVARAMAGEGANIVINGFGSVSDIEKERAALEKDFKVKAIYSPADMTKPAEIADMIKTAEQTFGSVDVLVNNAGIQHVAPVEEFPIEKWDMILAINLMSAFHTIRAAVPGMKARKWGRIINTASAHSLVASPFKSAYVTAKHGLTGLGAPFGDADVDCHQLPNEIYHPRRSQRSLRVGLTGIVASRREQHERGTRLRQHQAADAAQRERAHQSARHRWGTTYASV